MGGGTSVPFIENNISRLKNAAARTVCTNICLVILCKAQEDAFDGLSIDLALFLIRYVNVCFASKYSQMCD